MQVNFNILNQKGAPAVYEDSLANIPAPTYPGRLFVDTDSPVSTGIYRDTGSSWELIASSGSGGANNWDQVLALGGTFTAARLANANNKGFAFEGLNYLRIKDSSLNNILDFNPATTTVKIGDTTNLQVSSLNNLITTNNGDKGLFLDILNDRYQFGNFSGGNEIHLSIRSSSNTVSLNYNNGIDGLLLDYNTNRNYKFGQFNLINTGNKTSFEIDDFNQIIKTNMSGQPNGIYFDYTSKNYQLGQIGSGTFTNLTVNDTSQRVYTFNNGSTNGIDLQFSSQNFYFGLLSGGNASKIWILPNNVVTQFAGITNGLSLNASGRSYQLGQFSGGNTTRFTIDDINKRINTKITNVVNGLSIDYSGANRSTVIGNLNGGNFTFINIDDVAQKLILSGAALQSGTSGGVSGQHLVVTVNGVIYKIELRNP